MVASVNKKDGGSGVAHHREHNSFIDRMPDWILILATLVVLIALWKLAIFYFRPAPFIFPEPEALALALRDDVMDPSFWFQVAITTYEIVVGFLAAVVIAGVIGLFVTEFRLAQRIVLPYVVALQSIPKAALAPLIIIWFGFGLSSKIVIAAAIAFFPIFINIVTGFHAVDPRQLALMVSLGATRWQTFVKLRIPTAAPYIFAGFQIAVVMSSLGVVVAEFLGAKYGLGSVIIKAQSQLDVAAVFASVTVLSLITVLLHRIVKFASSKCVFWAEFDESPEA